MGMPHPNPSQLFLIQTITTIYKYKCKGDEDEGYGKIEPGAEAFGRITLDLFNLLLGLPPH